MAHVLRQAVKVYLPRLVLVESSVYGALNLFEARLMSKCLRIRIIRTTETNPRLQFSRASSAASNSTTLVSTVFGGRIVGDGLLRAPMIGL